MLTATVPSRSIGRSPEGDAAVSPPINKGNGEIARSVQPHYRRRSQGFASAEGGCGGEPKVKINFPDIPNGPCPPRRPLRLTAPGAKRGPGRQPAKWRGRPPVVRHTGGVLLLVPADPLRPRRADEHFAAEAAAARDAGIAVALIDHDALADPDGAEGAVARVPDAGGATVYRGWMMSSASYAALAGALTARGVTLRTGAAQYQQAHELPGWQPALAAVTPQAAWTDGDDEAGFRAAAGRVLSVPSSISPIRIMTEYDQVVDRASQLSD
jgi:hypothetical protein